MLLFKPVEYAFDTSRLIFLWDPRCQHFVCHLLDSSLKDTRLVTWLQSWAASVSCCPSKHLASTGLCSCTMEGSSF